MNDTRNFEVIIIGGSYAGLSAAMALGRSLRRVLIIDSGLPCNRQTPHSHNFITQDGEAPAAIAEKARKQVLSYQTVELYNDIAIGAKKIDDEFVISTQAGKEFISKKLIFATGIKDTMPDIKGFADCWGISVVHCPYCHGYELKNKKTGIIANGERAVHLASLVNNLTQDITVLTNGKPVFSDEQLNKFDKHKIRVIETNISEIEHNEGQISEVVFENGSKLEFEGVYAAVPFTQHSDIPESLGCEITEQGYIRIDAFSHTTIPGIFACGDNAAMMRSVANAVYSGNLTGAMVNKELTDEQF